MIQIMNNKSYDLQLEKILGQTNIYNKYKNTSKCNNRDKNKNFSILAKTMKIYSNKIDETICGAIIEYDINTIEILNKLSHPIDNLPNNVSVLIIHNCVGTHLNDLPNSITYIYFVNYTGELNCLSNGVKVINFGNKFNSCIMNLPTSVEEIITGNSFNKSVDYLPSNLKSIKFGNSFNQHVNDLLPGLEMIIFGHDFNQDISNLPNSVKYIHFDWSGQFSQPIFKLPENLEELNFNSSFSNDVCELPDKIKKITLGTNFSKPINLPKELEKIKLYSKYKYIKLINSVAKKNICIETYF